MKVHFTINLTEKRLNFIGYKAKLYIEINLVTIKKHKLYVFGYLKINSAFFEVISATSLTEIFLISASFFAISSK